MRAAPTTTTWSLEQLAPIVRYLDAIPTTTTTVDAIPDELFILIGRCEQPGDGWQGIAWDHRGSYNGGLGILNVNWTVAARNVGLPDPAYLATPAEQILGARDHARRHGFGGWSCWRAYHRQWGY